MKPKIYIETTVISYYTSRQSRDLIMAGHQQITCDWWDNQLDKYKSYISEIVYDEISRGDPIAIKRRMEVIEEFDYLEVNSEVLKLSKVYYDALDLPDKARFDAVHIALAVQHGMKYLVSWNFTHLVGARPREIIEEINYKNGIRSPIFCTPEELLGD